MFVQKISIAEQYIELISPEISHADISLEWVSGKDGRELLEKMGNNLPKDWTPSIEEERKRIEDFIHGENEVNWAIEYQGEIIGAVWLSLEPDKLIGPHIMIADKSVYGRGIATSVMQAVCGWALTDKTGSASRFNHKELITRCRVDNVPIIRVNEKIGFKPTGETYKEDGFTWQNYIMKKAR